jgi:hypothetical protein
VLTEQQKAVIARLDLLIQEGQRYQAELKTRKSVSTPSLDSEIERWWREGQVFIRTAFDPIAAADLGELRTNDAMQTVEAVLGFLQRRRNGLATPPQMAAPSNLQILSGR